MKNGVLLALLLTLAFITAPVWIALIVVIVLARLIHIAVLYALVWTWWIGKARARVPFVYDSPNWKEYIEANILPAPPVNTVVLKWSRRVSWPTFSLSARLFRCFAGERDFNPIGLVFERFDVVKRYRFHQAFLDRKHGRLDHCNISKGNFSSTWRPVASSGTDDGRWTMDDGPARRWTAPRSRPSPERYFAFVAVPSIIGIHDLPSPDTSQAIFSVDASANASVQRSCIVLPPMLPVPVKIHVLPLTAMVPEPAIPRCRRTCRCGLFCGVMTHDLHTAYLPHGARALEAALDEEVARHPLDAIGAGHLAARAHRTRFHFAGEGPVADEGAQLLMLRSGLGRSRRRFGRNDSRERHQNSGDLRPFFSSGSSFYRS